MNDSLEATTIHSTDTSASTEMNDNNNNYDNHGLQCWGLNSNNQSRVPRDMVVGVDRVGTGSMHTCAMKVDGTIGCWGHDGFGQVQIPSSVDDQVILDMSIGDWHGCVILGDYNVECWGSNQWKQGEPNIAYS